MPVVLTPGDPGIGGAAGTPAIGDYNPFPWLTALLDALTPKPPPRAPGVTKAEEDAAYAKEAEVFRDTLPGPVRDAVAGAAGTSGGLAGVGEGLNSIADSITGIKGAAEIGGVYVVLVLLFLLGLAMFLTHSAAGRAVAAGKLPV